MSILLFDVLEKKAAITNIFFGLFVLVPVSKHTKTPKRHGRIWLQYHTYSLLTLEQVIPVKCRSTRMFFTSHCFRILYFKVTSERRGYNSPTSGRCRI